MNQSERKGGFTLPGEAGYEKLTLELAQKWGADIIRDSDGTQLSDDILSAGYGIYSTICIIRDHNEWIRSHPHVRQHSFLMTEPVTAADGPLTIELMKDYYQEQFQVDDSEESRAYWQVWDRTANELVSGESWSYEPESGTVTIDRPVPWHNYTISFMAYRIWEEISMYNHITNHWDKEHLMLLDPIYPEAQEYLLEWLDQWCKTHPAATTVRFTSMFYNFVWIWGSNERKRNWYTDWASYDFTVSPYALKQFEERYGYRLTAEDFVNQGKLHVTHMPATKEKLNWMEFINDFVVSFGKKLIDTVHAYGKSAFVFYDDSWVGVEPYHERFTEFGFDGIIKAVFSGYEARLCAGVKTQTHELRLHPYLFPTGVDGTSPFEEEGNPTAEAQGYWKNIRRAMLREPIDRIGLGGYLHLVEKKPDFVEYIAEVADEFRRIRALHGEGKPAALNLRVAVLHYWGRLRSWTLSGHFHETYMHPLIHINESLSGLPVEVDFISFEDVKKGKLEQYQVVINAGRKGDAWSGGDAWKDPEVVSRLTEFVYRGGVFLGVGEPSAADGYDTCFRMAHVLGIDLDQGERVCHGRWSYKVETVDGLLPEGCHVKGKEHLYLTDGKTRVLLEDQDLPALTLHPFGEGMGIYLSSFETDTENSRMLLNLLLYAAKQPLDQNYLSDSPYVECAYFPESQMLVAVNNSGTMRSANIRMEEKIYPVELNPYGSVFLKVENGKD